MDLVAAIARHAAAHPERLAFANRGDRLTYGELATRSDALAAHLAASLPPRAPVVVLGHKQPEMVVGFLACMKSGRAYIPVEDNLPAPRVERVLASSGAPLVLAPGDPGAAAGHPHVLDRAAIGAIAARRAGECPAAESALGRDDDVYVIFTSGSTGEPKGVVISRGALDDFVAWTVTRHELGAGLRAINQMAFAFDASAIDLYPALASGGSVHAIDRRYTTHPGELRAALADADPESWCSTVSFAEMCLLDRRFSHELLPSLRVILLGGERLVPATVRRLRERFPGAKIYDVYGPTEATVIVTSLLADDAVLATHDALPMGEVIPGTRLYVVDGDGQPVPDGTPGEIVIEGPSVSRGYLGQAELTARVFSGPPGRRRYRTGDAGCVIGGELYCQGRIDHQIKLFGQRIELDDVAANLARLPAVASAAAIPRVRGGRCEAIVGFVVLREGVAATADELRGELATLVPPYMVPRELRIVSALPLTHNSKIDRARLAAELAEEGNPR